MSSTTTAITTRSRAASSTIAKTNYTTPIIIKASDNVKFKSNSTSQTIANNNEEYEHSHKVKKTQTNQSRNEINLEKHKLVEAKGRAKRIQLYKDLNELIQKVEAKVGVIPMPMILPEDVNDTRRKISKSKLKYNNEEILRKVYVIIQLSKKNNIPSTVTSARSTSVATPISTTVTVANISSKTLSNEITTDQPSSSTQRTDEEFTAVNALLGIFTHQQSQQNIERPQFPSSLLAPHFKMLIDESQHL